MLILGYRLAFMGLDHVKRLMALSPPERTLLLSACVLVGIVRIFLWLFPSRVCLRFVRRLSDSRVGPRPAGPPTVERVTWAVGAASRRIPRATCLTQAVAAQLLLRRFGYASSLCLGVARGSKGEFLAHAWVERDGRVLIGGPQSLGFTRLPALNTTLPKTSGVETV
jgi:hypothetical protein